MQNTRNRSGLEDGVVANELRTVSHTLEAGLANRLRQFAFDTRVSESAVLEHALTSFLSSAEDQQLANDLRQAGYGLRRKTTDAPAVIGATK